MCAIKTIQFYCSTNTNWKLGSMCFSFQTFILQHMSFSFSLWNREKSMRAIRLSRVFLINRGRLRDLPFPDPAHNCQNSRHEKLRLSHPPATLWIHKHRAVWVGIFMSIKWDVCHVWMCTNPYVFRIKIHLRCVFFIHANLCPLYVLSI